MSGLQQNAAITFNSVSKRFSDALVLDSLSVSLADTKITAIIGRSGCGKSTLLKLINGLLVPDGGSVEVSGKPIDYSKLSQWRRQIGYAVQGVGLFPHLSARDNICLLARLENWGPGRLQIRLTTLIEMCQLESEILDRFPHQLSGGQQQRVGLCRALMLNPPLLLLDEPFAALDPLTRLDIQQQLQLLQHTEPRTCVLVTHDMQEALRLADEILVMRGAKVVHQTNREQLQREHPNTDADRLLLSLLGEQAL